ncbi:secretin N-terminal domain-containing protein [Methylotenera sp.]|uniref:secretin N-terminal domain-containing protein n=1 Tax=Methylotenera sp. TaxID=2051956 RepID=UPI002730906F|nr:secretin N-terminal domain-containing protein [Methylotenera sp.]MDP2071309.1 secretin N-terminal domain-containing protein [Methylotenera sp.]MDP3005226.1 secretin N-terminal domain-containing protein [Methylotenera sp.]MDP3818128.1 secretin N-terminal domain-containing protein [Methylotenera sp.]
MKLNKNKCQPKQVYGLGVLMVMLATQISGCAFAHWDKPIDRSNAPEALVAEAKQNLAKDPEATIKRKNLLVTSELAVTKLFAEAEQARSKGLYEEANSIYDRVLVFLPDNPTAINGKTKVGRELAQSKKLTKATELIESNKIEEAKDAVHDVLLENPQHSEALKLQKQINNILPPSNAKPPQLKVQFDKPVTLELRDVNIKVAFEALSRATGINFILDKDIKPDTKATIFVKKARIEDAIELVLSSNGLQKKVLSENTVLVFPGTQQKLKDYQDLMIRSFYLSNTTAKQVAALIKSMLKTKDVFVDERLNMIVMRDTPEVIRIAEKLVAANDLADPEVMLEIEVLEVSRSRLQELGVEYPNRIAVNSLIPITTVTSATGVVASSTVNTSTQLTLEGLLNLNKGRFDVSPNPAVNFRKTTGDVNLLSNPRIRVRNNEKAKILVGDKVPVITTTSTANVGISENVQYVDVGLKLDVEPRITADNYVNIKVGLEVSSLGERTITRNGATVYTIGTRNANTILRLKDGETQVLAGLISDDERKNASKLPGLGDIPLIGRLFANQQDQKTKTEIVLAITPRILANIARPTAEISEYWSGTETLISDKPQVTVPVSEAPLSALDKFRERIRAPLNRTSPIETTDEASTTEQVEAPQPENTGVVNPEITPPSIDPANPPVAP